jgi:hypothetical protein
VVANVYEPILGSSIVTQPSEPEAKGYSLVLLDTASQKDVMLGGFKAEFPHTVS